MRSTAATDPARTLRALPVVALRPLGGGRFIAITGRWRLHVVVTRAGKVHLATVLPLH